MSEPEHDESVAGCADAACRSWWGDVTAWAVPLFGGRHLDLVLTSIGPVHAGVRPIYSGRAPTPSAWLVPDPDIDGPWIIAEIALRKAATKATLHELVDAMWPDLERLQGSLPGPLPGRPRQGLLGRPARMLYWRQLHAAGLSNGKIAEEWGGLADTWQEGARPGPEDPAFPAWREWAELPGRRCRRGYRHRKTAAELVSEDLNAKDVRITLRKLEDLLAPAS